MNYIIKIEKAAQKFIRKQSKPVQERLLTAIYKLPDGTDIKKLSNSNYYRLRVGNFRVLYTIDIDIKIIDVENVDNRGDVYKRI